MHGIIKRPAGRPAGLEQYYRSSRSIQNSMGMATLYSTHARTVPTPLAFHQWYASSQGRGRRRSLRCTISARQVLPLSHPAEGSQASRVPKAPPFSPFPSSRCCCSCRGSLASCGHAMPVSSPKYFFPHSIPHEIWTGRADPSSGRREIATAARGAANLLRTRSNLERDKRLATHPPNGVRADNAVPDRPPTHRGAPRRLLLLSGAAPHASANRGAACLPAPRATTRLLDLLAHVNPTPGAESCHGTSPPLRRNANPTRYLRRGCFPSSLPSIRLLPLARRDVGVLVNVRTHSSRARSRPLGRTVSRFHPW